MLEEDQFSSGRKKQNERDIERGENTVQTGESLYSKVFGEFP
jgi:hypothetical protein